MVDEEIRKYERACKLAGIDIHAECRQRELEAKRFPHSRCEREIRQLQFQLEEAQGAIPEDARRLMQCSTPTVRPWIFAPLPDLYPGQRILEVNCYHREARVRPIDDTPVGRIERVYLERKASSGRHIYWLGQCKTCTQVWWTREQVRGPW